MGMTILVTGSRDWEGPIAEHQVQQVLGKALDLSWALSRTHMILRHGACPTGADQCADRWGLRRPREVLVEAYPADWKQYGKAAGFRRNEHMVSLGADLCIAFSRNASRGTAHCLNLARDAGIPTFIVDWGML